MRSEALATHDRGGRSSTSQPSLAGTVVGMAEDRTWTAAELERMTPDERHRLVRQGVITDLADVSHPSSWRGFAQRAGPCSRNEASLLGKAMEADRRVVRVADAFFEQLDADRGPGGEPSATDFLVLDLPVIVEHFATDFEDLPEIIDGVPQARMLIATGRLVRAFAVYGLLASDGSIDLIGVELDL